MNEYLQQLYKLYFTAQHTHWNYTGGNFEIIHNYASEIQEFALESIDDLVEMHTARGLALQFNASSSLPLNNLRDPDAAEELYEDMIDTHIKLDELAETSPYPDLDDILGGQSRALGKMIYKMKRTVADTL